MVKYLRATGALSGYNTLEADQRTACLALNWLIVIRLNRLALWFESQGRLV